MNRISPICTTTYFNISDTDDESDTEISDNEVTNLLLESYDEDLIANELFPIEVIDCTGYKVNLSALTSNDDYEISTFTFDLDRNCINYDEKILVNQSMIHFVEGSDKLSEEVETLTDLATGTFENESE